MNLAELAQGFVEKPLALIAAAQLLAIATLFFMLVRSFNARVEQAMRVVDVSHKLAELCETMTELLEDIRAIREARARRRAGLSEEKTPTRKEG